MNNGQMEKSEKEKRWENPMIMMISRKGEKKTPPSTICSSAVREEELVYQLEAISKAWGFRARVLLPPGIFRSVLLS